MQKQNIEIEFGPKGLVLALPEGAEVLSLPKEVGLADPAAAILRSLREPIGTPPFSALIAAKARNRAVIVVSDNTRPVPYKGAGGILEPLIAELRAAQVLQITILVATGTHRQLDAEELRVLLPESVFSPGITVVCHDCEDTSALCRVGTTRRGTEASLNRHYLDADIRILTGLVEPHFMAGFSGGRKSICPGIVGQGTTHVLHGPELMAHPRSESFILNGNPCHEEALEIARMAPPDFIVNVTINEAKEVTGVFAGEMVQAHEVAAQRSLRSNTVTIPREYDLVITHAGFVGINHYQAGKAACEASKAVRPGGSLLLLANHTDKDPVGSPNYRSVLAELDACGQEPFTAKLFDSNRPFVPEQWQVQMWVRALRKLQRPENLLYYSPQLDDLLRRRRQNRLPPGRS
ncbi:MAG: nickel-dependent lactate racemase, partial [Planctomycetes bacterium]|nr:nickel-dependent lactate racemase [Planctomycetota bacterium]